MKIITLMEDKAASGEFVAERGLCQYIETAKHKILFDMGPSGSFVENAKTLGVDLGEVDIAVLSHGHSDHGGGLETFCFVNHMADVFVNPEAFGDFYAVLPGQEPRYIGLSNQLWRIENRMVPSVPGLTLGGELTFLGDIPNTFEWTPVVPKLQQKTDSGFVRDEFRHEQHLLVSSQGKTVLFAGCAHGGIVNIVRAAEEVLGKRPDAVFAGFHLFELDPEDPRSMENLTAVAAELSKGDTVYYAGHCTGDWAFEVLQGIMGDRMRPMRAGSVVKI